MNHRFTTISMGQEITIKDVRYVVIGQVTCAGTRINHYELEDGSLEYIDWVLRRLPDGEEYYLSESYSSWAGGSEKELSLTSCRPVTDIQVISIKDNTAHWIDRAGSENTTWKIREQDKVSVISTEGHTKHANISDTLMTSYLPHPDGGSYAVDYEDGTYTIYHQREIALHDCEFVKINPIRVSLATKIVYTIFALLFGMIFFMSSVGIPIAKAIRGKNCKTTTPTNDRSARSDSVSIETKPRYCPYITSTGSRNSSSRSYSGGK